MKIPKPIKCIALTTCFIFTFTTMAQTTPVVSLDYRQKTIDYRPRLRSFSEKVYSLWSTVYGLAPRPTQRNLAPKPLSEVIKDMQRIINNAAPAQQEGLARYGVDVLKNERPDHLKKIGKVQNDVLYDINCEGSTIVATLKDKELKVRQTAAEALGKIGVKVVQETVFPLDDYEGINISEIIGDISKRKITIADKDNPAKRKLLDENGANAIFLSRNEYLVRENVKKDQTLLARAIVHIDTKALMQVIVQKNSHKYAEMKKVFLKETSVISHYKKLISEKVYSAMAPDNRFNGMVAKIFELLTVKHLGGKMILLEERFFDVAYGIRKP